MGYNEHLREILQCFWGNFLNEVAIQRTVHGSLTAQLWPWLLSFGGSALAAQLWPLSFGRSALATQLWPLSFQLGPLSLGRSALAA